MDAEGVSDSGFTESLKYLQHPDEHDRHLAVRFYEEEMEDAAATKEAGRPIFKTVECVEIRVPGDKGNIRRGPLKYFRPDPRERFPLAYAKFKAKAKEQIVGTLLRECGGLMPRTRALEYQHFGVFTVEQLAALNDSNAQNIPGSIADRQKARDFLAIAKGQAPLAAARAENEQLREQLRALEDVVREQGEWIAKAKQAAGEPQSVVDTPPETDEPPPRRRKG